MKKKLFIGAVCTILTCCTIGCSANNSSDSNIPESVSDYCTSWEEYNEEFGEEYTYSPNEGVSIKTVNIENNISEVEFALGSNLFRSIIPTKLLEADHIISEYHDYEKNGVYDFLLADGTSKYLYWFGFVPNSENAFTKDSLELLAKASAEEFATPAGYSVQESYERFVINNDDYFAVVMECDNLGVSESDKIDAESMHGYYVQLYDKTSLDYLAQFIGGADLSADELEVIKNSVYCLRMKH